MKVFIVCVEYADILSVTLPRILQHFHHEQVHVVTTHTDYDTLSICMLNRLNYHATEAFYARGAVFNKWKALEEAIDRFGRNGWIMFLDADIVLPDVPDLFKLMDPQCLHAPLRRMVPFLPRNLNELPDVSEYHRFPIHPNVNEWAGYCQWFHSDCPVLRQHGAPWHATDWIHAGGADSFFQALWPPEKKLRPEWTVLHLGPAGENWMGRVTPYVDGSVPAQAEERSNKVNQLWQQRRQQRDTGAYLFEHERLPPPHPNDQDCT